MTNATQENQAPQCSTSDMCYEITVFEKKVHIDDPFAFFTATIAKMGLENVFFLESLSGPIADTKNSFIGLTLAVEIQVKDYRVCISGLQILTDIITQKLLQSGYVSYDDSGDMVLNSSDVFWILPDVIHQLLVVSKESQLDDSTFSHCEHGLGLLTYYGYDSVYYIEKLPRIVERGNNDFPDAVFRLITSSVEIDKFTGDGVMRWISGYDLPAIDPQDWLSAATNGPQNDDECPNIPEPEEIKYEQTEDGYISSVEKCKDYIRCGDIYQVQIGHQVLVKTTASPLDIYRRLRFRNPSPYMSLLPIAEKYIIGASPELFVRTSSDTVVMRPLAGTARRGESPELNDEIKQRLISDEKERAEHIMLVDLCRNDFGRIAAFGSIDVTEFVIIEQYSHLFHLVSNVEANLRPEITVGDVIKATFPAGTVTGAPKIRAMEIIEEQELSRRGFYGGAFGIINSDRSCVIGLALRTIMFDGTYYHLRASAGIVADSSPYAEWQETLTKLAAPYWAVIGREIRQG